MRMCYRGETEEDFQSSLAIEEEVCVGYLTNSGLERKSSGKQNKGEMEAVVLSNRREEVR